jgi:multidrug efflux pump subunit AcrA (membrane-fusion protein)
MTATRSDRRPRSTQACGRLAAVLLVSGLAAGCQDANKLRPLGPPEVTVALPVRQDVTDYLEFTGTAQPFLSVDIRARVKGFLKERHFREGAFVKKGDLLLVIEERPFRVQLDQAKTRLAEAEASLRKARQSKSRQVARAQLALDDSQLDLARIDVARQKTLVSRNAGTREEMDRADANLKKTAAQVDATRASLVQADADYDTNILAADANVGATRAAVENMELELSYCRMYAPMDGRISRMNFHEGNLVGDGQSTLLANVVAIDPIHAYVNVSERDLLEVLSGRTAATEPGGDGSMVMELGLANEPGYPHKGKSDYQDPSVDAGTGTIRIRGRFENRDGAILPGMFLRVRVPYKVRKDALLVPESALGTDQRGSYLLVVGEKDMVKSRHLTVGAKVDRVRTVQGKNGPEKRVERFRVVTNEIGPEDRIIIQGLLRARDGVTVVPKFEGQEGGPGVVAKAEPAAKERN